MQAVQGEVLLSRHCGKAFCCYLSGYDDQSATADVDAFGGLGADRTPCQVKEDVG